MPYCRRLWSWYQKINGRLFQRNLEHILKQKDAITEQVLKLLKPWWRSKLRRRSLKRKENTINWLNRDKFQSIGSFWRIPKEALKLSSNLAKAYQNEDWLFKRSKNICEASEEIFKEAKEKEMEETRKKKIGGRNLKGSLLGLAFQWWKNQRFALEGWTN